VERDPHTITGEEVKRYFVEQCDEGFAPAMTDDEFIRGITFIGYGTEDNTALFRIRCEYEVRVPLDVDDEEEE
jgi:hypothetical protein